MMTAIKPGTMKFLDFRALLYQTRHARSTGTWSGWPPRAHLSVRPEPGGVALNDRVGIAEGNGRGVGIATVNQQLDSVSLPASRLRA